MRPIPEVNRETYHALGRLAADLNHMARRVGERSTELRTREVLEALELVARLVSSADKSLTALAGIDSSGRIRTEEEAPTASEEGKLDPEPERS